MYDIRLIQIEDNPQIAQIIRHVSQEYGLAPESGFAVADHALDDLYSVYTQNHAQYWVIVDQSNTVLGGGGLSRLQGEDTLLEIQKMYFSEQIRGQGFAKKILELCFEFAKQHHYQYLYLETTQQLSQAVKLYEKMGFKHLEHALGNTGHSNACEIRMLKKIK